MMRLMVLMIGAQGRACAPQWGGETLRRGARTLCGGGPGVDATVAPCVRVRRVESGMRAAVCRSRVEAFCVWRYCGAHGRRE